jgi:hypothetical protein
VQAGDRQQVAGPGGGQRLAGLRVETAAKSQRDGRQHGGGARIRHGGSMCAALRPRSSSSRRTWCNALAGGGAAGVARGADPLAQQPASRGLRCRC